MFTCTWDKQQMSHNSSQGHVEENILLTQSLGFTKFISVLRQEAAQEMLTGLCTERDLNPIQNIVCEPSLTCRGPVGPSGSGRGSTDAEGSPAALLRLRQHLSSVFDNIYFDFKSEIALFLFLLQFFLESAFSVFFTVFYRFFCGILCWHYKIQQLFFTVWVWSGAVFRYLFNHSWMHSVKVFTVSIISLCAHGTAVSCPFMGVGRVFTYAN